jgi:16S rRNA A1518/A1519 N6-dimethyltransferase RsmA/KsgA/DIM1 with predicted DNA glycosylase/AP lyase activity
VLLCLRRRPDACAFQPATKKLIREFFTQRRKQIGALVRRVNLPSLNQWLESLPAHGLNARARPEELPLAAWLELDAGYSSPSRR